MSSNIVNPSSGSRPRICDHSSCLMSALKAFINSIVYGGSLRFFHSLFMNILFKKNMKIKEFFKLILNQTYQHALYAGLFGFSFKLLYCFFNKLFQRKSKYNAFLSGFISGFLIFGEKTNIKYQIVLYILGRAINGLGEKFFRKLKIEKIKLFPYLSAFCFGLALYLFESDKSILGSSLTKSLQYLIKDSDKKISDWNLLAPNDFGSYLERTLVI